jgi:secreted protein with Ig-like and vWFA domain
MVNIIYPDIDCGSGPISSFHCEGDVDPLDSIELEFTFQWNETWNTTAVDFIWRIGDEFIQHQVVPDQDDIPCRAMEFNGDIDDPKSCIELKVKKSQTDQPINRLRSIHNLG